VKNKLFFRAWFYFRQGWSTYFAFIFAALNTMVVTYYLAIEQMPTLKNIFPEFWLYLVIMTSLGVPILVLIGFIHFKRLPAFHSETDISIESNPYYYKLPPGYMQEAFVPFYLTMTNLMVKSLNNEKLTEDEMKQIKDLQKKLDLLIRGGYVGKPQSNLFSSKVNND
jgi:hypothetical protein